MKTERNAVKRPWMGQTAGPPRHPNMELKGIYKFMEMILEEIHRTQKMIEDLRDEDPRDDERD